jgi:hypothetical protein
MVGFVGFAVVALTGFVVGSFAAFVDVLAGFVVGV